MSDPEHEDEGPAGGPTSRFLSEAPSGVISSPLGSLGDSSRAIDSSAASAGSAA